MRCDLDLQVSVFDGPSPSISALMLYARLRSAPDGSSVDSSEYSILCRDASCSHPFGISKSEVTAQEVARLLTLLDAAGLPRRAPRVVANESLLCDAPYLALEARIRGRASSLSLSLQSAGFSGEDAEPLRAVLVRLVELTPAGRRSTVRDVVGRLVIDRALAVSPGHFRGAGTPRVLTGIGRPAQDALAGPVFGAPGRDGQRGPLPSFPPGALADR
jgi:hypothetical protein